MTSRRATRVTGELPGGDGDEGQVFERGRLLDVDEAATEELQQRQKGGDDLVRGLAGQLAEGDAAVLAQCVEDPRASLVDARSGHAR